MKTVFICIFKSDKYLLLTYYLVDYTRIIFTDNIGRITRTSNRKEKETLEVSIFT